MVNDTQTYGERMNCRFVFTSISYSTVECNTHIDTTWICYREGYVWSEAFIALSFKTTVLKYVTSRILLPWR